MCKAGTVTARVVTVFFPLLYNDDNDWDGIAENMFLTILLLSSCGNRNKKNKSSYKWKTSVPRSIEDFQGGLEQQSSAIVAWLPWSCHDKEVKKNMKNEKQAKLS